MDLEGKDASRAVVATGIMLGISGLGCLVYLPILLKSLNGVRRVYIVLQQICIIGFLLTNMLNHAIMNESNYYYVVYTSGVQTKMDISLAEVFVRRLLASLFQAFFLYGQYFLSFMQSWDVYNMIQNPLSYAEFCQKSNILKYLAVGLGVNLGLVLEKIAKIIVALVVITDIKEYLDHGPQMKRYHRITDILDKYRLTKFVLTKMIYSVVIIIIAIRTKAALKESSDLTTDKTKKRLYKRLFLFTLIPLGINFWNLSSECLDEIWPLSEGLYGNDNTKFFIQKDTRTYISASTATIASFSYFVAFPLLFPKVKQSITCGLGKE